MKYRENNSNSTKQRRTIRGNAHSRNRRKLPTAEDKGKARTNKIQNPPTPEDDAQYTDALHHQRPI